MGWGAHATICSCMTLEPGPWPSWPSPSLRPFLLQPNGWPNISNHPDLYQAFAITSFALSLLMLFKTNSAYARYLVGCPGRTLTSLYSQTKLASQEQVGASARHLSCALCD